MRKLLFSITRKGFDIQTFCSGGKGGQHQNKTESGVRIVHRESGAVGECRNFKSQHRNKRTALERLVKSEKFQKWHKIEAAKRIYGEREVEAYVERMMNPKYLKIESRDESGEWTEENE